MVLKQAGIAFLYGLFVYFVAMEKIFLAALSVVVLVVGATVLGFFAKPDEDNSTMPLWGFALIFLSWIVAYLAPPNNAAAIPIGLIAGLLTFVVARKDTGRASHTVKDPG